MNFYVYYNQDCIKTINLTDAENSNKFTQYHSTTTIDEFNVFPSIKDNKCVFKAFQDFYQFY